MEHEAYTYIWHNTTLDIMYIGYHKRRRKEYTCSSYNGEFWQHFADPEMEWEFNIIFNGSVQEAFDLEQQILTDIDLKNNHEHYYNRSKGGQPIFTPDVRKKMSDSQKKIKSGKGNPFYGKTHTDETKALQSHPGKKNGMFGRSAIAEQNLKWHTNGTVNKLCRVEDAPAGWRRGKFLKLNNNTKTCPNCNKAFKVQGYGRHIKACAA